VMRHLSLSEGNSPPEGMLQLSGELKMLESKFLNGIVTPLGERFLLLEQVGSDLERIVAQSLRQAPPSQAPLMAWPLVCGSAVAERTRALSFVDGVLCVAVTDLGWKAELQSLAPRYLASINRYTVEAVRRIEFVVAQLEPASIDPR